MLMAPAYADDAMVLHCRHQVLCAQFQFSAVVLSLFEVMYRLGNNLSIKYP